MSRWREVLVPPSMPISRAIEVIDRNALQIALVVGEGNILLGTVTDGDVRRGIIRGVPLADPVERIMCRQPTVVPVNEDRESVFSLMRSKGLQQIPVVDEGGRVAGIEVLKDLIRKPDHGNLVVLMAGGKGRRLHPLTEECPKPMLRVGRKPILETILESFLVYGFRRFAVSVNYRSEMIEHHFGDGARWGAEIRYIREESERGTAGALSLIPERPEMPFIVMNGDLLTKVNFGHLLDFHTESGCIATLCVREYEHRIPFGVVTTDGHRLAEIREKPVQRHFVSAGIYVFEPEALDRVPGGTRFDMPELFARLKGEGRDVAVFPVREYWIDIGRMDDLDRAHSEFELEFPGS